MSQKRLLLLVLIWSSIVTSYAQRNTMDTSIQAIHDLKNGVLVVIVPSYHKKIKVLEKAVRNPKTKASKKKRNKKLIAAAKKDRQKVLDQLYEGFSVNYDFSEVAFIHDTATVHIIKKGIKTDLFLKDERHIDLGDKPLFFLRYGYTDRATTTGIEAWIIADRQLQDLQKPFPYYVPVFQPLKEVIRAFFVSPENILFSRLGAKKKEIGFVLNEAFWDYYDRHY